MGRFRLAGRQAIRPGPVRTTRQTIGEEVSEMCRRHSLGAVVVAIAYVLLATELQHTALGSQSIALETRRTCGARVYVITVDLNDPRNKVEIGLPLKGISHSEAFMNMVRRHGPVAAVTGTYFCTRSLLPVGTIVSGGKTVFENCIGNTICFAEPNGVRFIDSVKGERVDFAGAVCGLRAGPRLLKGGHYALSPRREGFRQSGLFGRRTRMAVGLTAKNKLLLVSVASPATFGETATIMRALGAVDALCLDGGSSSAMYYRGRVLRSPGRALTNIIEVHSRPISAASARGARPVSNAGEGAGPRVTGVGEAVMANDLAFRNPSPNTHHPLPEPTPGEEFGLICFSGLCRAEGRGPFFPVYRAKLSRLKGLEHPKGLFDAAAHV